MVNRIRSRPFDMLTAERRPIHARAPFAAPVFCIAALLVGPTLADEKVGFNRYIRPILSDNCFECHGPDENTREADLRLDTRDGALADLGGYAAVVPGKPEESELWRRISSEDPDEQMPPDAEKRLTPAQIGAIRRWIEQGAHFRRHWALEPIRHEQPPVVKNKAWPHNLLDHFVLAGLEQRGITPSPEADPYTLVRRLYLDLIGLPPTPDQVDAFVDDQRPDAYERVMDELLSNPHYGERWGRYWLDQARYADSHGYTNDNERTMWPYRDWVIRAFNQDMSFDQFTIEQLAGDLLPNPSTDQLVATGFHRNTLINTEGGTKADQFRVEQAKDRVDTTGVVWMGLTIGCAKCHSHKYDPIEQQEYYELCAFFDSTADRNSVSPTIQVPTVDQKQRLDNLQQKIDELKRELKQTDSKDEQRRTDAEKELSQLESQRDQLRKQFPTTMVMRELDKPRTTHVHIRGDFLRPGDEVQPDVPESLPPLPKSDGRRTRLDLARWLIDAEHPLTARVRVNRLWMRLFGCGLVETENDFGTQGSPPTHPELLDWLATEFRQQGWSTKRFLRLIVTSATYRQSSHARPDLKGIDPRNELLARQSRLRVEAELVRDMGLAVGGLLSDKIGGPSVYPPQPDGVYAFTQVKKNWRTSQAEDRYRRGMYTFFYRSAPHPMLTTFDVPKFNQTCTRRDRSNTPLQSLTVANAPAMFEMAQALGARLTRETPAEAGDDARLTKVFRLCLARPPEAKELARLRDYLQWERTRFGSDSKAAEAAAPPQRPDGVSVAEAAAWTAVARVLINLDEFITRE